MATIDDLLAVSQTPDFPADTVPELREQIRRNDSISKETCRLGSNILKELRRRSSNPPKE